jgi:hypothetical protein
VLAIAGVAAASACFGQGVSHHPQLLAQAPESPCAKLAAQIRELSQRKAEVERLNEQALTTHGVNPRSSNYIMERVNRRREELRGLLQEIERDMGAFPFSPLDLALPGEIDRYNTLVALLNNDIAEISSGNQLALREIELNKITHGYDGTVRLLAETKVLHATLRCIE